ncbi:hypothetical protein PHYPO_G00012400 [Pangasianodon hypophthalmus]|uniref:Saposin B-type domain-containing protein n=1 Tax=Pangasianodon hypophthalmus TaxID=310915 RepID=A0A5N5N5J4_PANHP|nr:antimicrobial peptide NK-lysin isoform X1 [Pangasianodon hypophthalmus]KAB5561953.1 hypothetical protein PHYPO_G00012400 [Pangasianodon hypophthalmus]
MSTPFQLGVLLLFIVGAVQCQEQIFSDNGLMIKTYEHDMQRGVEAQFSCPLCKKILQEIFKSVGNELSKDRINRVLNKVCQKLKPIKPICTKFINKYKDKLVRAISSAQTAPGACKHLRLCKNAKG